MAAGATIYVFCVRLADADRGVYQTLNLRLARHPSETADFLFTRLLAYCLEYTEGIAFSRGLSEPDEPAIAVRDLTGALQTWIDIGNPEATRLHKAAKAARRVVVFAHRDAEAWLLRLQGEPIHRGEAIEIRMPDRELLGALASRLERRMDLDLAVAGQMLYLTIAEQTFSGALESRRLWH
jgi:uncharacterized protein YaeQ